MARDFRNDASMVGFIGDRTLEDVISCDAAELAAVGGSFEAIGRRMKYFIDEVSLKTFPLRTYATYSLMKVLGREHTIFGEDIKKGHDFHLGDYMDDSLRMKRKEFYDTTFLISGEKNIELGGHDSMNGLQSCPFMDCPAARYQHDSNEGVDSDIFRIRNRKTNRVLSINNVTVHLALTHQVLEKDNEYGISAGDFYTHFMPEGMVDPLQSFRGIRGSIEEVAARMAFLYGQVDVLVSERAVECRGLHDGFDLFIEQNKHLSRPEAASQFYIRARNVLKSPMAIPGVNDVELLYSIGGGLSYRKCVIDNDFQIGKINGHYPLHHVLRNKKSGKELWLNPMVVHMAGAHGLLYGDGSQYDISVKDFYEHFMK